MIISNTAETVHELNTFRKDVNKKMTTREIVNFNISDIEIENEKMSIGTDVLTESATKKVLSRLRVKNNFLGLSKSMTTTDWNLVKDKLKNATGSQSVHGRKIKDGVIDDIYMTARKSTGALEIDAIFDEVIDAVIGTGKDISVKSTIFLEDKDEVVVTLLDNGSTIDIFGTDDDNWKTGKRIVWSSLNFSISPFFERLVCTNGNTGEQYGFRCNISNNKFNINKIKKQLEKEIVLESDTMTNFLVDAASHLKSNNVSAREFLKFRNMFNEEEHSAIIKKWLDDSTINRTYGHIISDMPELWRITADTGKNAYDFFNDLTYIAAHPLEAIMTDRQRIELQIKASDLLFRKSLDLELIAPKVKFK